MNTVKRKYYLLRTLGAALAAAVFLGSCSIGLSPDTRSPEEDLAELDAQLSVTANSAVAAADAQLNASGEIGASTTYNNPGMDPITVEAGATEALPARGNYPYPGWTTTGEVEHIADPAGYAAQQGWAQTPDDTERPVLFKVTAIARPDEDGVYPESEVREVYYVTSTDDQYEDGERIFDPSGWGGTGYRDEYIAEYTDGSRRRHWISNSGLQLAPLNITDSLDFETVISTGLEDDSSAEFSSVTMYTHTLRETFNYWFWNDNAAVAPSIVGWRYYTEHTEGDELVATSLTIEYTFNADPDRDRDQSSLLARSVIREEMRFEHNDLNSDGVVQTGEVGGATDHELRLRTEINNTSNGAHLVYTRQGKSISKFLSRGNAGNAKLAGVQRDTLPNGYNTFASEFSVALEEFEDQEGSE